MIAEAIMGSGPSPSLLVNAENEEDAEGWVDALQLCSHLASLRRLSGLHQALQPPAQPEEAPLPRKLEQPPRRAERSKATT